MRKLLRILKDIITMPVRYFKHKRMLKHFNNFNQMYDGMNRNQRRQLLKKYGMLKPKRGR